MEWLHCQDSMARAFIVEMGWTTGR